MNPYLPGRIPGGTYRVRARRMWQLFGGRRWSVVFFTGIERAPTLRDFAPGGPTHLAMATADAVLAQITPHHPQCSPPCMCTRATALDRAERELTTALYHANAAMHRAEGSKPPR